MKRSRLMCHLAEKNEELSIGNISRGELFTSTNNETVSNDSVFEVKTSSRIQHCNLTRKQVPENCLRGRPTRNTTNYRSNNNDQSVNVESDKNDFIDSGSSLSSLGLGPDSDDDPEYKPYSTEDEQSDDDEPLKKIYLNTVYIEVILIHLKKRMSLKTVKIYKFNRCPI